jgi:hypothetical protein
MPAYAQEPTIERLGDQRWRSESDIECWKGSPSDLGEVLALAVAGAAADEGHAQLSGRLTLANGEQTDFTSVEDFMQCVAELDPDDVTLLRFDVHDGTGDLKATLIARHRIPGVVLTVEGRDRFRVLGVAQLAWERLSENYVDRLGSWRLLLSIAIAVVPAAPAFYIAGRDDVPQGLQAVAGLLGLVVALVVMLVAWGPLQNNNALTISPEPAVPVSERQPHVAIRLWRNRWVQRGAALLGALGLAILSNLIAAALIDWL